MANLKYLCNEDVSISTSPNGVWSPNGSIQKTTGVCEAPPGKKIIVNNLGWSPSGCVFAPNTFVSGSSSGISATSIVTDSNNSIIRDGDIGTCAGTFINPNTGATIPCSCSLSIGSPGQVHVQSE